ncbi:MAG: hypothetical protein II719_04425 [Clostridia bacterium]|nr:hypothetical protein [Clostridia bacterium]
MTRTQQIIQQQAETRAETKKKRSLGRLYYFRIARYLRIGKFFAIGMFVAFLVFAFVLYREEMTAENLQYFFRYIDTRNAEKSATTDTITYSGIDSPVQFGIFKGGLVVVSNEAVQIYDLTGETTIDVSVANASPHLLCGDRYMMVYNVGAKTFQLYTTLGTVYEESYKYEIGVASLGTAGSFLLSTRSVEYRSVVTAYDRNFEPVYRWSTPDKLVMAAAFAQGDKEFLIAAAGTNTDGSYYTEILVCEIGKEEKRLNFSLNDEIIYRVGYASDGGFILVGRKAVYFYEKDGTQRAVQSFEGYSPTSVGIYDGYLYYTVNKNLVGSNYELSVVEADGTLKYRSQINGEITRVLVWGEHAYILLDRSLLQIDLSTGAVQSREVKANAVTVLGMDSSTIALCYTSETIVINTESFFGEEAGNG